MTASSVSTNMFVDSHSVGRLLPGRGLCDEGCIAMVPVSSTVRFWSHSTSKALGCLPDQLPERLCSIVLFQAPRRNVECWSKLWSSSTRTKVSGVMLCLVEERLCKLSNLKAYECRSDARGRSAVAKILVSISLIVLICREVRLRRRTRRQQCCWLCLMVLSSAMMQRYIGKHN